MANSTASWKHICARFRRGGNRMLRRLLAIVFSRENLLALTLAVLLVLLIIFTIDTSSTWIYQGF